jgi:hypothetical protein
VVVGAHSENTALLAAYATTEAIRRVLGIPVGVYNFVINNTVGAFWLDFRLNLDLFLEDHPTRAAWDPETFHGLNYYCPDDGVSFVLFEAGKNIVTGGKSEKALYDAYAKHLKDFEQYSLGAEYRNIDKGVKRKRPWFSATTVQEFLKQEEEEDEVAKLSKLSLKNNSSKKQKTTTTKTTTQSMLQLGSNKYHKNKQKAIKPIEITEKEEEEAEVKENHTNTNTRTNNNKQIATENSENANTGETYADVEWE